MYLLHKFWQFSISVSHSEMKLSHTSEVFHPKLYNLLIMFFRIQNSTQLVSQDEINRCHFSPNPCPNETMFSANSGFSCNL